MTRRVVGGICVAVLAAGPVLHAQAQSRPGSRSEEIADNPDQAREVLDGLEGTYRVDDPEGTSILSGTELGTDGVIVDHVWELDVDLAIDPTAYPPRLGDDLVDLAVFGQPIAIDRLMDAIGGTLDGAGLLRAESSLSGFGTLCVEYGIEWSVPQIADAGDVTIADYTDRVVVDVQVRTTADVAVVVRSGGCAQSGNALGSGSTTVPVAVGFGGLLGRTDRDNAWLSFEGSDDTRRATVRVGAGTASLGSAGSSDFDAYSVQFGPPTPPEVPVTPDPCDVPHDERPRECLDSIERLAWDWGIDPDTFEDVDRFSGALVPDADGELTRAFPAFPYGGVRAAIQLANAEHPDGTPLVPAMRRVRGLLLPLAASLLEVQDAQSRSDAILALTFLIETSMAETAADLAEADGA